MLAGCGVRVRVRVRKGVAVTRCQSSGIAGATRQRTHARTHTHMHTHAHAHATVQKIAATDTHSIIGDIVHRPQKSLWLAAGWGLRVMESVRTARLSLEGWPATMRHRRGWMICGSYRSLHETKRYWIIISLRKHIIYMYINIHYQIISVTRVTSGQILYCLYKLDSIFYDFPLFSNPI